VSVVGIVNPVITRACGHDQDMVHANLSGKLHGAAWLETMIGIDDIPEAHRLRFASSMRGLALTAADGTLRWKGKDWIDYINGWHLAQQAVDAARQRVVSGHP
jgi:hypothetical protein